MSKILPGLLGGMGELNYEAIFRIFDLYDIDKEDQPELFETILAVARTIQKAQAEKIEVQKKEKPKPVRHRK